MILVLQLPRMTIMRRLSRKDGQGGNEGSNREGGGDGGSGVVQGVERKVGLRYHATRCTYLSKFLRAKSGGSPCTGEVAAAGLYTEEEE
jgi:hypothetical protein